MSVWYGPLNSPIHKSKSRERRSTNFRDANPGSTVGSSGTEKVFVSLLTDGLLMSVPFTAVPFTAVPFTACRPFYCLLLLPLDDQRIDVTQIDGTHLLSLPKADTLISYY